MPSLTARIMGFFFRNSVLFQWMLWGGDISKKNFPLLRRFMCPPPGRSLQRRLSVRREEFQSRAVWHIGPHGSTSPLRILYWHGGGFVFGPMAMHWKFIERLATNYGISFIVPLYPLAPEADALQISQFTLDFYRETVDRIGAANIVMAGDSAGGTLTAVTSLLARAAAIPLPKSIILISPAMDGSPSDHPDYAAIRKRDGMLNEKSIDALRSLYVRDLPVNDIRVCPIDGDYSGFPPILMFAGTDDVLVIGARAFKAKVPEIDYIEGEGLFHCWPIFSLPESRAARSRIAEFASRAE